MRGEKWVILFRPPWDGGRRRDNACREEQMGWQDRISRGSMSGMARGSRRFRGFAGGVTFTEKSPRL